MSAQNRLSDLQRQLLEVLGQIEAHIARTVHERCPYRAADDSCTFNFGCQNKEVDRCTR